MSTPNIFDFDDCRGYLQALKSKYPGKRRPITLTAWAKILGLRSERTIAMVINGQRPPSAGLTEAIPRSLGLNASERRYFELLALKAKKARSGAVPEAILAELASLRPKKMKREWMKAQVSSYIARWHHLVIKQLIGAPGFKADPAWIVRRLRGKVRSTEVQAALETLVNLGIIKRSAGVALTLTSDAALFSPDDVPSEATRQHHKEMMDRAKEALDEQAVLKREFISLTFRADPARIGEIKKFFREFRDRLDTEFYDPASTSVFQANLQFFEHTNGPT